MKNYKLLFAAALFLVASFTFTSCEEDEIAKEIDLEELSDIDLSSEAFDLTDIEEATNFTSVKSSESSKDFVCMTVTVHENNDGKFWPRSVTLDFGAENCTADNGKTYRGKIHVIQTAYWKIKGASRTTTFEDFYVNDFKIEGTKVKTNNGFNEDQNISFTRSITDGKITAPEGKFITYNATRTWELIEGFGTHTHFDNVYSITGNSSGTNWKESTYSRTITTALRKAVVCKFPESGIIEIIINEESPITLDYGDGTCDAKATVSRDGVTKEIIFGQRFRNNKD